MRMIILTCIECLEQELIIPRTPSPEPTTPAAQLSVHNMTIAELQRRKRPPSYDFIDPARNFSMAVGSLLKTLLIAD